MKFITLALIGIISVIMQSSILPYFNIMGTTANLVLAVVLSIALLIRKPYGGIMGLIIGLLMDILFSPIIGVNALIYFLMGYVLENIEFHLSRDEIHVPIIIIIFSTVVYNFLYFVILYFASYEISFMYFIMNKLLIEIVYNSLLIIPLYKIISSIYAAPAIRFYRD